MSLITDILQLRKSAEHASEALPALMMRAENIARSVLHGEHARRKSGQGKEFWQFREYSQGDRPQDIDWRQSAKTDHIYIRQKEWHNPQKNFLWCAGGKSMDYASDSRGMTKQQTAQLITLALALLLRQSDEQIGLYGTLQTGHSEMKLEKITQGIWEQADKDESLPPIDLFTPPAHAVFIGVSDFLEPVETIEDTLTHLASGLDQGLIIQVLDPAELKLPFNGRITFHDSAHSNQETINHVPSIREAYKERIHAHIERIITLCERLNWAYILHCTDTAPEQTLKEIWGLYEAKRGPHT